METSILGNYTSSFHPTALLRKQILNVLSLMEGIGDENLWPSIEEFEFHKFGKSSIAGQNSFDPQSDLLWKNVNIHKKVFQSKSNPKKSHPVTRTKFTCLTSKKKRSVQSEA